MSLPHSPLTTAVYERLTGDDGTGNGLPSDVEVFYAGAQDTTPKYVAITLPLATGRETFSTEGHDLTLSVRCHTEHPVGDARPLDAFDLGSKAKASLSAQPLDIGPDHALLHLPTADVNENRYDVDEATDAYDVILRYDIMTQTLA